MSHMYSSRLAHGSKGGYGTTYTKLHKIISLLWSDTGNERNLLTFWIYSFHSISVASTNVTTRQEKSFRVQNINLSG